MHLKWKTCIYYKGTIIDEPAVIAYDEYNDKSIVFSDEFIKKCLDSTNIYSRLINYEKIDLKLFNGTLSNTSYKTRDMFTCHPLLNYMIIFLVLLKYIQWQDLY